MLPYCKAVQSRRPRTVSKRGNCSATRERIPILKRKTEKRKMSHLLCCRSQHAALRSASPSPSSFWQHFLSPFLFPGCHTLISSLLSVQRSREKKKHANSSDRISSNANFQFPPALVYRPGTSYKTPRAARSPNFCSLLVLAWRSPS